MAQYEELKSVAPRHERQTGQKLRYCTVVPMAGNPSVQAIPVLNDPEQITQAPPQPPKPTPDERKILLAWWNIRNDPDFSGSKLYRGITGSEGRPNSKQLEKYRELLRKFNQKPNF